MEIGTVIAEARKAAGLQQKDVALALGISPAYLSDIEGNRRAFSADRLPNLPAPIREKVAEALVAWHYMQIEEFSRWLPRVG